MAKFLWLWVFFVCGDLSHAFSPTYDLYDIFCIDRALQALVELERAREERASHCTMLIVDSKFIQNADAGKKRYDAGKKSGVKLHIGVDILGLPHMLSITSCGTEVEGAK